MNDCRDHWHHKPARVKHECSNPNRTLPCPTCQACPSYYTHAARRPDAWCFCGHRWKPGVNENYHVKDLGCTGCGCRSPERPPWAAQWAVERKYETAAGSPTFAPEQSPHWTDHCDTITFVVAGFPFNEGFPTSYHQRGAQYELALRTGEHIRAQVDVSRQYSAEGLRWEALTGTIRRPSRSIVVAWQRIT